MAKAKNDWKERLGVVYSTNPDFQYSYAEEQQADTLEVGKQNLRVALDKKQRAGKVVTLVTGFVGRDEDLKELGRRLKQACGVGGSAKDGEIIVQGDFRVRIADLLRAEGYRVKQV